MATAEARLAYAVSLGASRPVTQSRWKALLRLPLSVPILLFSMLLQAGAVPAMLGAIVARGQIPRWLFDFQVAANRWQLHAAAYALMLTDDYPPLDGRHSIHYEARYPARISRRRVAVWKFISAIPHFAVLLVLGLTLLVVVPVSWLFIIFTGRYPRRLHGYTLGILRWAARVHAYVVSLTDEYPPFTGASEASSPNTETHVLASGTGIAVVAAMAVFLATVGERESTEVSYADLLSGAISPEETRLSVTSAALELTGATDPADALFPLLRPESQHRFVQLEFTIENTRPTEGPDLSAKCFSLGDAAGSSRGPLMLAIDGRVTGTQIAEHEVAEAFLLFELPTDTQPIELRYSALDCAIGALPFLRDAEVITYKFR